DLPAWDEDKATYLDPATGEVLPTWDEALDAIGADDEPLHVARFGDRFDAKGVLAGSKDANRWLGYGIQPKNPKPGMRPGACKGKAHRREYLGYAGRRVLVSRKWSGKTLAD